MSWGEMHDPEFVNDFRGNQIYYGQARQALPFWAFMTKATVSKLSRTPRIETCLIAQVFMRSFFV